MSSFAEGKVIKIQSEILEPIIQECIGDWLEMMATQCDRTPLNLSVQDFKSMLRALWWVTSKANALHAQIAISNFQNIIDNMSEEKVLELAKDCYNSQYNETMKNV